MCAYTRAMREPAAHRRHLTFEEFLAIEAESDLRHEFVGGWLHAMAGGTQRHNQIATNIIAALANAAEDSPCAVYGSDMLVKAADDAAYYPSVSVNCGPSNPTQRYIDTPCLIVEIASPSTIGSDRRDKLMSYRRIESLQAYLIVFQDERRIIRSYRDAQGAWWDENITEDGAIRLHCPDTVLTTNTVYRGVAHGTVDV